MTYLESRTRPLKCRCYRRRCRRWFPTSPLYCKQKGDLGAKLRWEKNIKTAGWNAYGVVLQAERRSRGEIALGEEYQNRWLERIRRQRSCFSSRSFSPPEGARKNPPDFVARDGQADGRDLCFYATTHHLIMLHRPAAAKVLATQFAPSQHQSSPRLNVIRESSKVDLLCSVRVAYRSVSVSCVFFSFCSVEAYFASRATSGVSVKPYNFIGDRSLSEKPFKLAALNVLGAPGDKMTNEWIEWNESARIVGRLPLRSNPHHHHPYHPHHHAAAAAAAAAAAGMGHLGGHHGVGGVGGGIHGNGSSGLGGGSVASGAGSGANLMAGLGGIHNNNNVSFLNNNQQSFLNSYSLNKLAAAGMGLKTHALMKGLQKPRGAVDSQSQWDPPETGSHTSKAAGPCVYGGGDVVRVFTRPRLLYSASYNVPPDGTTKHKTKQAVGRRAINKKKKSDIKQENFSESTAAMDVDGGGTMRVVFAFCVGFRLSRDRSSGKSTVAAGWLAEEFHKWNPDALSVCGIND
ncbi:hypothetical protein RP20_CCG019069 [Aedes albopictus]|nr:hypothetical protein RP20_CCG019069 [Aedes albopictus]